MFVINNHSSIKPQRATGATALIIIIIIPERRAAGSVNYKQYQ